MAQHTVSLHDFNKAVDHAVQLAVKGHAHLTIERGTLMGKVARPPAGLAQADLEKTAADITHSVAAQFKGGLKPVVLKGPPGEIILGFIAQEEIKD
jgi:hypothetical protein